MQRNLNKEKDFFDRIFGKISNYGFLVGIVHYVKLLSCDLKFTPKFDENWNYLAFNNGVLELDTLTFRTERKEDMISIHVNYDYIEASTSNELDIFLSSLLPDPDELEYLLYFFAIALDNKSTNDMLPCLIGGGANGKSMFILLMSNVLGSHLHTVASNFFTAKSLESNSAQPVLMTLKNKRIAVCPEPSTRVFASETVKRFCGSDLVQGRNLFEKNDQMFEFQTKC